MDVKAIIENLGSSKEDYKMAGIKKWWLAQQKLNA